MDIEKLKEQAQQALDSGDLETAKDLLAKIKEAKEERTWFPCKLLLCS